MRNDDVRTDLGKIKIHSNVISSIASIAACEISGVKRMGKNLKTLFFDLLGKKNGSAIKIDIDKSGQVTLEIPLIVKYGFNIPDISGKVQDNVRNSLEKFTNLSIKDINIKIKNVVKE
jgi:uncharacterized alkaline shock family protein YloU